MRMPDGHSNYKIYVYNLHKNDKINLTMNDAIVLTLDAGGTNFVFSAIRKHEFITKKITLPSFPHDLTQCIAQIIKGFETVLQMLDEKPAAISFAFPGPADYPNGIIRGYLPNFPSFREGVALKRILEKHFEMPVFINNDADLFAYGEAMYGTLPHINNRLREYGSHKQYRNLLGYTFGTGFGFGFVSGGRLHIGDNSCVETFCLRHKHQHSLIVEEGVSARAVTRAYNELAGTSLDLEPKDVFDIAEGNREGNADAARESFRLFGEIAGDAIATAASLIDGVVVVGGGITAARKYFMPAMLKEMRDTLCSASGETVNRLQMQVFNLDDESEFRQFATNYSERVKVLGYDEYVEYDPVKRIGIATSTIGATKSISIGAALYALNNL